MSIKEFAVNFYDTITGKDSARDGEIVHKCDGLYRKAKEAREKLELDWLENIKFVRGDHWDAIQSDYDRFWLGNRRAYTPRPDSAKTRVTVNLILPLHRQVESSILSSRAMMQAFPATTDPDDVTAAELSTDVLQAAYYSDKEDEKRKEELKWAMDCGWCLRHTYWDTEADGIDAFGVVRPGIGDVVTDIISPFSVYLCPWPDKQWNGIPWLITAEVLDIAEINALFPGKEVKAEEVADAAGSLDKMLSSLVSGKEQGAPKKNNAAILKVLYHRPNPKAPRGKVIAWANNTLLMVGELPDEIFTFVIENWYGIAGQVYSQPFVTPLKDPQREYNTITSQLLYLKNKQLSGDMVIRGTGDVRQEYVRKQTGVNNAGLPTYADTSQKIIRVPAGVLEWKPMDYNHNLAAAEFILEKMDLLMKYISGVNDPFLGQAPKNDATLGELQMLRESDLRGIAMFADGFNTADSYIAQHKLLLRQKHYIAPRLVNITGQENAPKTIAFDGAMLGSTKDVRPKAVPLMTESMKQRERERLGLQGVYGPYANTEDQLAKMDIILNSALPDAREIVDKQLSPMTYEQLAAIVGEIRADRAKGEVLAGKAQLAQLEAVIEQAMNPQPEADGEMMPPQVAA